MKLSDIEMHYEFRTHCPKCGTIRLIRSVLLTPEPYEFRQQVESMRRSLEQEPRKCCNKRVPVIGKEWEAIWPLAK